MRMTKLSVGAVMATLMFVGGVLAQSKVEQEQAEIKARSEASLQTLFNEIEGSKANYDKAAGYAVFVATKAGFIVTGGGGSGMTVDKATGKTVYMKMGMGGVGLGIGGQRYDMVILFESAARLQTFIDGGWDSTAAVKAVAGRDAANLATGFIDGTIIYTFGEKGLMASVDISGTRFWVDEKLN